MQMVRSLAAVGMLSVALTACRGETPEADGVATSSGVRPYVMTVTVHDYSFHAPDSIPAGLVMIQALMRGEMPHHVNIVKLDGNRTAAEYVQALAPGSPPPEWATEMGGPNPTDPGTTANAMLVLEPGNYAVICFVDIPEHVPHFARGMFRDLKVYARTDTAAAEGAVATAVELPPADVTMRLLDYDFTLDRELRSGRTVFRVVNDGPQVHEVFLAQLHGETTMQQALEWLQNPTPAGPPPFTALGGVAPIAAGQANNFTANLRSGRYALLCFIPDSGDGRPHLAHGMMKEITVR
jgi:hypothetical protein